MRFFVGLHHPSDVRHFDEAFISINTLRQRKSAIDAKFWILDSGAFSELSRHGRYMTTPQEYAAEIRRWATNGSGTLLAAVTQDWMTEPFMLAKTGLTVADHQQKTIERYDEIVAAVDVACYVMPVIQGWHASEYVDCVRRYGTRLARGAWVGVGSICKRQSDPAKIAEVLLAIKRERPDLRLHGFGVKATALLHPIIRELLSTADSMAWSYAARRQGRDRNSWREAKAWSERIMAEPAQSSWTFLEDALL